MTSPLSRLRSRLYDAAIVRMTARWYRAVLERLPARCHLLDVGIGTGSALLANADLVIARDLRITGVDPSPAYVDQCRRAVSRRGLDRRIGVRLESVHDHRGGPYGGVYFSGSFMVVPDPVGALRHVSALLAPEGRVWFTQTVEGRRSRAIEVAKPMLRLVTTIDFGRVTYAGELRRMLAAADVELEAWQILQPGRRRAAVLAVGRPRRIGRA